MPLAPIDDFEMYYESIGQGTPVVCSTGWGTGTGHKVAIYPPALAKSHQLIVYDHRGIGRSRGGLNRQPSTELYASDVVSLMDHLGIEQAHIFGRGGLGGCIAQHVAARCPARSRSVVVGQAWAQADAFLDAQLDMLGRLRERSFEEYQVAAAWLCHKPSYFNRHRNELLGKEGAWSDIRDAPEAHLALIQASRSHNAVDALRSLALPTLIIQGGMHDWITGERLGISQHELAPHAILKILTDAPHAIRTDDRAWKSYVGAIVRLYDELERGIRHD